MISEKYKEKVLCSKCGNKCYKFCFLGKRAVCVDCFCAECEKREADTDKVARNA